MPKGAVQSVAYSCDAVGNLLERHDTADGLTDSVSYDTPKRLTQASTSGTINDMIEFGYDAPVIWPARTKKFTDYRDHQGLHAYPAFFCTLFSTLPIRVKPDRSGASALVHSTT